MPDTSHPSSYERSDANPRLIGILAIGLAIFLGLTPFALCLLYPAAMAIGSSPANLPMPPEPRLQVLPKDDLARLRSEEDSRLAAYGWVDREHSVARIPIGHAMRLVAERGLAGWPPAASPPPAHSPSR